MDQDQNRGKNKNLIDYANTLLNLKRGAPLLRVAAAGIGSTAIWAVGIIIGALILTFSIAVFSGGQGLTSETSTGPQQAQLTTCTDLNSDPTACLMRDFKIQAIGFPTKFATEVYNAFAIFYKQSSLYRELWGTGETLKLTYNYSPFRQEDVDPTHCHGEAFSSKDMAMWNMNLCTTANAYLIIHELGHVISWRRPDLFNSFNWQELAGQDGQKCYHQWNKTDTQGGGPYPPYLRTYLGNGLYPKDENFAETLADYVVHNSWNTGAGLTDFSGTCPATYTWAYNNVFRTTIVPSGGL